MKRILLASLLMLCATSVALGQLREPAPGAGTSDELRGVTRIFVRATGRDHAVQKTITETIQKKLPHLTFVSTATDAEVWLTLAVWTKHELIRVPPNPNDGMASRNEVADIVFVADGQILRASPGNSSKLIKGFRRQGSSQKTLGADFAKEFVRVFEKANMGLSIPKAEVTGPMAAPAEMAPSKQIITKGIEAPDERRSPADDVEVLRIDTDLVSINVSVLDGESRYISTLSKDIFSVYDEGVKQDVAFFASVDEPFTVALLIDTSRSVKRKLQNIVTAANSFVEQLRPNDKLMAVTFDSEVREIVKTARSGDVRGRGISVTPGAGSRTLIYDAVAFAIRQRLNLVTGRKAIILLTDGVSDIGEANYSSSLRDAEEAGALIFPIQFDTYDDETKHYSGRTRDRMLLAYKMLYESGTSYLEALARKSGGRFYRATDVDDFSKAFASIVKELNSQYSLGYYPRPLPKHGERRRIKVFVDLANVAVRTRSDYVFTNRGSPSAPSSAKEK